MLFLLVVALVVALGVGHACYVQGTQPMQRLKPGMYTVLAIIYPNSERPLMVLSWHVDYGHYEYRISRLKQGLLMRRPNVGDVIDVQKRQSGLVYEVTPT